MWKRGASLRGYLEFNPAIADVASMSKLSSPGDDSTSESTKSLSNAKSMVSSLLARYVTSNRETSSLTSSELESKQGSTTNVLNSSGMPSFNSSFGRTCGFKNMVISQFVIRTASALDGIRYIKIVRRISARLLVCSTAYMDTMAVKRIVRIRIGS